MAKTKSTSTSRLGKDSRPKYLGIKLFAGQKVKTGQIILRQRGTKFLPGRNVGKGSDFTLYALKEGFVNFRTSSRKRFDKKRIEAKIVDVFPEISAKKKIS